MSQVQNIRRWWHGKLRKPLNRNKELINCIENLSNEIFYEIFDYLDGYDIYKAFFNLNNRFENILLDSSFLLKIEFSSECKSILEYDYKQLFIYPNKNHIISFHFYNQHLLNKFCTLYTIDSSFNHLESLILYEISTFKLSVLLFYLKSLPRLFSLTIFLDDCTNNLGDIYRMIFILSTLKYLKLELSAYERCNLTLSICTNEKYSSLEYLSILHNCTLNEFINIISYTPRLTHLYCDHIIQSEHIEVSMRLNNLVHLTLSIRYFIFDEFEKFIVNLSSKLRLLNVTFKCRDENYLDANRWERLIIKYMPYLNKFIFNYTDDINENFQITSCHTLINYFISPFWIERQWLFRILIEKDKINYLIRPYTEKLYDFQEHQSSLIHYYPGVNIKITEIPTFVNKISSLSQIVNVTRLTIKCNSMFVDTFIKILNLLPNLDMIQITLLSSPKNFFSCDKDRKILRYFLNNNKITRLTLKNVISLEQIYFILDLFPRIQHFAIRSSTNANLLLIVECTLRKIKKNKMHHPMTFCIGVIQGTNDKVEKLKKMIDSKHLLNNYTVYRRYDKFYVQWK